MIRSYRKNGRLAHPAESSHVVHVAVHDAPADPCCHRGSCRLRHPCSDGLYKNSIRPLTGTLNRGEQLLALIHRVVGGVDDLKLDAEPQPRCLRSRRLLHLEIVFFQ